MLLNLTIKNFALIEDTHLEFSSGLNVLTGETGSGKSIILDALGLTLGDKAQSYFIRKEASRLSVTAHFSVDRPRIKKQLEELALIHEEDPSELMIRRDVDLSGRSRAFVNDQPVNISTLRKLGDLLVHAHGQHDHQILMKANEQRDILDSYGHLDAERRAVADAYKAWQVCQKEQASLQLSEQERSQRLDLYRHQKQDIGAVSPKVGEDIQLEERLPRLKNAEKIQTVVHEARTLLQTGESAALDNVRDVLARLETLQSLGVDVVAASDFLKKALVHAEEAAVHLESFNDMAEADPIALEKTLTRLDQLSKLKKKYGPELSDVLAYQERVLAELDRLENLEGAGKDMAQRLAKAEKMYVDAARVLSEARQGVAKKMTMSINKQFKETGLPHASFHIEVSSLNVEQATSTGIDQIIFLFTPNPGEGQKSLADVASGGELSRVMLSLKSVLAKTDAVSVLIFDEIDAGVGGALGRVLGKKLLSLGKSHQVLAITHLAAIAACADAHFTVSKEIKKDRTHTQIQRLSQRARVQEISRLFGGATDEKEEAVSLKHAQELMASVREDEN